MKSTFDLPDNLLKQVKMRALEESITLRELVITALQAYLLEDSNKAQRVMEEAADGPLRIDEDGWPLLNRAKDDDTVITEDMINQMREEMGV